MPGVEGLEARDNPSFLPGIRSAAGHAPNVLATGDFHKDGKKDLATIDDLNDLASVQLGKGNGTFQALVSFAMGDAPAGLAVSDFNGDGGLDLLLNAYFEDEVRVLLQV